MEWMKILYYREKYAKSCIIHKPLTFKIEKEADYSFICLYLF